MVVLWCHYGTVVAMVLYSLWLMCCHCVTVVIVVVLWCILVTVFIAVPLWCNCCHFGAAVVVLWSLRSLCFRHCDATLVSVVTAVTAAPMRCNCGHFGAAVVALWSLCATMMLLWSLLSLWCHCGGHHVGHCGATVVLLG